MRDAILENFLCVLAGQSLAKISLIQNTQDAASATALEPVESADLGLAASESLVSRRPEIGPILLLNPARQLGKKLSRGDERMVSTAD